MSAYTAKEPASAEICRAAARDALYTAISGILIMKDSVTIGIDVGGSNIAIALIQAGDYDNAHYTSIPYVYKSSAYELSSLYMKLC